MSTTPWTCRILGHRYAFTAQNQVMLWRCERDCDAGGAKEYGSATRAAHFAAAFDRRDSADLGRRAPLIGLLPLRLWRWWREARGR